MKEIRVLSPTAILGYGFPEESFNEGMRRKPHVIAVDAGSTDPGPYYLGAGYSFTDRNAVKRDLSIMIPAALEKETFLDGFDNKEPVNIHRYYLYKRLLIFYRELFKKENRKLKKYSKEIVHMVKGKKWTFSDVYATRVAAKTEEIKTKMFIVSPLFFRMFMAVNDKFILPIRLKRMEKKKC